MKFQTTPLYDSNRFAPWELFCSAFRAHKEAERSKSSLEKLHHNRSLLLFSFAFMEALLNYAVRKSAAGDDVDKLLRYKKIIDKIEYLENKTESKIQRAEFDEINANFKEFRDEIVHFKMTDQQPQFFVQYLESSKLIQLVQTFSVAVFVCVDGEFPYWLTGWNYTGFNYNMRDLFWSNNGNGFGHSLGYMGFKFRPNCGPGALNFAELHMSTLQHFKEIRSFLDAYEADADPVLSWSPTRPRLLKNWWCPTSLEAAEREVMQASGMA